MKSFIASVLAALAFTAGFAVGCAIWATFGYGISAILFHAPISGALTGIAYQLFSCYMIQDQLWSGVERNQQRLLAVLEGRL